MANSKFLQSCLNRVKACVGEAMPCCLLGGASLVVVHGRSLLKQLGQSRDGIGQDYDISINHVMETVLEALDNA